MIRWGVIGLGNIAKRFGASLMKFDDALFYAGASHNAKKRQYFKDQFHVEKLYDDYDEMLNDTSVDAVYIALPHKMHALWAKKAMLKGKSVLVEKPVTIDSDELKELIEVSQKQQVFFMEAMKTRFMPVIEDLHDILKDEEIVEIHNSFCGAHPYDEFKNSYIYDPSQGGALYDMGVYGLAAILDIMPQKIKKVQTQVRFSHQVDAYDLCDLTFENGVHAYMECAMDDTSHERDMTIRTKSGSIYLKPFYRPTSLTIEKDGQKKTISHPCIDDFHYEIAAVHEGIRAHRIEDERMSHEDSLREVLTMERIKSENYG